ncbi:MAG: hypothetical protein GX580_00255 [Candidatus Hydrogenedens sp.]|nr:metallophosphoesterase [Candidatus Hydrogenedentota bacterium]NLF56051.1 hypothetical protein [Candidatus Hydrogenedens sp.]
MWQFVQISDPHLSSTHDGQWNNRFLCTMMPEVMACLRRDLAALRPDFLLVTGDVVSRQTRDAMMAARDGLESLGVPYYPMGGNHDFVLPESRGWFLEAFAHRLPEPATIYSFTHKNLRFHVLDAWWCWRDGSLQPVPQNSDAKDMEDDLKGLHWGLPEAQLDWLDARLAEDGPHTADIVAVHYPALPIPERLRFPGLRDGGCLVNGDRLLGLMDRYPRARAVFSGHVHAHFMERRGRVTQVTTGSLPEFPVEFRLISVHDDRMEVETLGLSDPSFAERSLIPGHGRTAGQPEDRNFSIPLS